MCHDETAPGRGAKAIAPDICPECQETLWKGRDSPGYLVHDPGGHDHYIEPPGSDNVTRTSGGRADAMSESGSGDGPRTESKKGAKGAGEAGDNGRGLGKPHEPARQSVGSQFDQGGELTGWKRDERVAHERADAETHREAIRTCRGVQDEGERSATYRNALIKGQRGSAYNRR